jgi:hypothetical protein
MRIPYRRIGWLSLQGIGWLFRGTVAGGIGLARLWAARSLLRNTIPCSTCGHEIPCLGLWECGGCGYRWHGWYFSRCEVCGDVPPWIECERCGASTMNPLIFGQRTKR